MIFDTHAHYDDEQFDSDRDQLLDSLIPGGISLVVDPGSDLKSSRKALEIAESRDFVYAAVGYHPHDAKSADEAGLNEIRKMTESPRVVAIGEIGLDYHYDFSPRDIQKSVFRQQMQMARELKLPVVIHEREACADCLEIVREFPDVLGEFHCFSGSVETAKELISMGWYLGFNGVVTFKNARKSHEVIKWMPLDRLLLETDCPYLAPVPVRGTRNSSLNLPHVVAKIAELRGVSGDEIENVTMENGKRFFGIK
jgi:TatD DNase family protein